MNRLEGVREGVLVGVGRGVRGDIKKRLCQTCYSSRRDGNDRTARHGCVIIHSAGYGRGAGTVYSRILCQQKRSFGTSDGCDVFLRSLEEERIRGGCGSGGVGGGRGG